MSIQADVFGTQLNGVVDRIEGDFLVIILSSGKTISWPKESISEDIREGSSVTLTLQSTEKATQEKSVLAKTILNEILTPNS